MKFVVASASPRRKKLFKKIAEDFEIDAAKGEERADKSLPPAKFCETLAAHKAREIAAKKEHFGKIIVGADTVVATVGNILGKPKDEEDAKCCGGFRAENIPCLRACAWFFRTAKR